MKRTMKQRDITCMSFNPPAEDSDAFFCNWGEEVSVNAKDIKY